MFTLLPLNLFIILATSIQDSQETLRKFEEASATPRRDGQEERRDPPRSDSSTRRPGNIFDDLFHDVLEATILHPFFGGPIRYDVYPYALENAYFRREGMGRGDAYAFDATTRYGRVEHDLHLFDVAASLRLPSGDDARFEAMYYVEKTADGIDTLAFERFELNYGFSGAPSLVRFSTGWGVAFMQGERVSTALSLQAGLEIYPAPPLSFHGRAGIMFFGGSRVWALEVYAAWHVGRMAFTFGVHSLINDAEDLTAPTLGMAMWF
ncbi:MAG: hypothetical protein HY716_08595 [Planctomycetes bacterium]|nr:hypothetical protein [Planctomycetota bacterium]